jgi:oxygen-independent coproporphyrinogen-3 oxidase
MAVIGRHLGAAPVTEIAIGGGSPNFLAPDALRTLSSTVDRYFAVAADARRSIELDPRATTVDQIDAVAALGFRSLSLGVQDFSTSVQDAIRRHQTVAETRRLVACARAAGFDDVNIDIVYGLPRQTEVSFARTLEQVISLQPDRVALFGYAHLPSRHPQQHLVERAGRVLDRYERAALLLLALETFEAAGYVHLGLDHFARPGSSLARAAAEHRMIRTFQGFVEQRADAIVGIGASAISSTGRAHWQNHFDLATWERAISTPALPVDRGFELSDDDRTRAAVIDRLMCEGEVDLGWIARTHRVDPEACFAEELAALGEIADLATYDRDERVVRTTPLGRLLVRNVCMVFDRYHRSSDGPRHSYTV